ncbi:MAG: tight adherence protein [Solirubrobacteraceae bacterium]|nr:tight adherence protein [Solirubrobacteraceae bacterium]
MSGPSAGVGAGAPAALLAALAAALAVAGAWELLTAIEGSRPGAALARALEPVARAGREGRAATAPERRRIALITAGTLAGGGWLLGGPLLGLVAGLTGPMVAATGLRARRRAYGRAVAAGAAGAARAVADALAAGHAVRGALAVAGDGLPGAAGVELRRAAAAVAVGAPTEAALEALRRRARVPAWDALVAGILLQRDAGGDLVGLLRDHAEALEAAARAEQEARSATAQARATARIVLALPAGAAVLAELASPGFLAGLLARPASATLMALALMLQLAAIVAVRRLGRMVS